MHKMRSFTVGIGTLAIAAAATAQFDGPAPLAWRWIQPTSASPGGSPLVNHGTIYQSDGGRIFCIDKDSGNLKWRFPQLDPIEGVFRSTPLLSDDTLIAVGDNKLVYAVDAHTGNLKWSANIPAGAFGAPVLVGSDVVIALSDNTITALKVSDGSPTWGANPVYKVFDGITGNISVSGRDVLFFTNRNQLIALNVDRRAEDWHRLFDQVNPNPTAVVYENSIYLNSGPYLISLSGQTGKPRWQYDSGTQLAFSPVIAPDMAFLVSEDGKAIAVNTVTQKPITKNKIDLGSLPIVRPTLVGTKFIVPTSNGALNLIDPKSYDAKWIYVIHPLIESPTNESGRPGGTRGGPPSGGAGGIGGGTGGFGGQGRGFGGGGGGGLGGGANGQRKNNNQERVISVQAAAPAVLAGETLIVPAKDGSILAFDKDLGVDLTPPKVEMLFPNAGDQISGQPPLVLLFKVADEASGLKINSLKVEINGQPINFKINRDGTLVVRFSLSGNTIPANMAYGSLTDSGWLGNRPLADGRKEIVITAEDWMGNEIKKSFSLSIDNTLRPLVLPGTEGNQPGGPGGPGGAPGGGGKGGGFGGGG